MAAMFADSGEFDQDINAWKVSAVTTMGSMFSAIFSDSLGFQVKFNNGGQPRDLWDVGSCKAFSNVFARNPVFNIGIDSWQTSAATAFNTMFEGTKAFNQPLDSWQLSAATRLDGMFRDAEAFNQPLDSWNTASVKNFGKRSSSGTMFSGATAFSQKISSWDLSGQPVAACGEVIRGVYTPHAIPTSGSCLSHPDRDCFLPIVHKLDQCLPPVCPRWHSQFLHPCPP